MKTLLLTFLAMLLAATSAAAQANMEHFITRSGEKLMEGEKEFRFISFNIPNLHYVEDHLPFAETSAWRLPDEFEMNDALLTIRHMGGRVARTYVLPVRHANEEPGQPFYVTAPGQFNEEAFRTLDKLLELANRHGIRLIIPFVDQWKWWGGIGEYAAFRGRKADDFWSDPQLIDDFKQTIKYVLTRRNTYTGKLYREDKAILAWETGNELYSPTAWTSEIAAYIKSLDPNHLTIDGYHAGERGLKLDVIDDPNIDIITTHHYPNYKTPLLEAVETARQAIAGRKVYFVGEVGFIPTELVGKLFDQVIRDGISGALVWSLRYRHRDGGFYWHSEPAGGGLYKAYHWPGFPSGEAYDETNLLKLMRAKAFEIQNIEAPPPAPPDPPGLLPIASTDAISWRGSTGATSYDVERAALPNGPWILAGLDIDDTESQYRPLFADRFVKAGERYYYRVRAKNEAGISAASNVVGPVRAAPTALIDEMRDYSRLFARSRGVTIDSSNTRQTKEKIHRFKGNKGDWVIYRTMAPMQAAICEAFFPNQISDLEFYTSSDGVNYLPAPAARQEHFKGTGAYGYWKPVTYRLEGLPKGTVFLKIMYRTAAQLNRVEVR